MTQTRRSPKRREKAGVACRELLSVAVKALEDCGCQFWACKGPEKRPRDMETCYRCWALYDIYRERPDLKTDNAEVSDPTKEGSLH